MQPASLKRIIYGMACSGSDADEKVVHTVVSLVLKDAGFSMETVTARRARELATAYLEWSLKSENDAAHQAFSKELVHSLEGCFGTHESLRARK